MSIAWFPGHMASARKKAAQTMGRIDVVVELLDARLPGASANPLIEKLRRDRQRPCLRILNQADLADPDATAAWLRHYGNEKLVRAVALSCKRPGDVAKVPRLAAALVPHRDSPLKPVRMIVMGVPNVGKSTLINALLKRKVAKTGDEPAVTREQSRFQLDGSAELIDTPGLMPPVIKHPADGLMLAASHLIGPESYQADEVAAFLAGILLVFVFAVQAQALPSGGYVPIAESPGEWLRSLLLPWLSLGLVQGAVLTRYVRSAVLDVMREDYLRTARAKGRAATGALWRHGLRNASIPVVTVLGLQLATLLIGAVVVERVFVIPGLGDQLINGVAQRDLLLVQGVVMVLVAAVLLINFVVDVAYRLLDPRLR